MRRGNGRFFVRFGSGGRFECPETRGRKVPDDNDGNGAQRRADDDHFVGVRVVLSLAGEQNQQPFGDEQVERESDDVGQHEFGILLVDRGVFVRFERPQAVPEEAVRHAKDKRDGLRHPPRKRGKGRHQQPKNSRTDDGGRSAHHAKLENAALNQGL